MSADKSLKYYKTLSNILQIRTISAKYHVAMKLMAGRQYKNDLSDVVSILVEQEDRGEPLPFEIIKTAIENLYESYNAVPENSRRFIEAFLADFFIWNQYYCLWIEIADYLWYSIDISNVLPGR